MRTRTITAIVTFFSLLATACGPTVVPHVPSGAPEPVHFPEHGSDPYSVVVVSDASGKTHPGCTLPCDMQLPSGTTLFAFRGPPNAPVGGLAVVPQGPSEVTFHRKNRALLIGGGVLSIAGLALGFPLALDTTGGPSQGGGVSSTDLTLGVIGLGALVVGTVLMLSSGSDGVEAHPGGS
ncbi:MAG TPA: hypothetical protein VMI75_36810 [Polyangiaceae bacterium]|nr:hypothetical protein [Polyangiaceae bacterium]